MAGIFTVVTLAVGFCIMEASVSGTVGDEPCVRMCGGLKASPAHGRRCRFE